MIALPVLASEAAAHVPAISPIALLVGLVLLLANGFFVAAEISLLAARRARIEERAEAGERDAIQALQALRELSITFSGAQLGITMASLGLGAVAEPAVAGIIERGLHVLGLPEAPVSAIGFGLGLAIVVFLHMVVGEMVPRNLALGRPEQVALRLARPFRWFALLLRPLIVFLNGLGNVVVRLLGTEPVDEHNLVHTPEELALALRESQRHGTVEAQDVRVMSAALRLAEIDAEAAMTPRVDLSVVEEHQPVADVLELAAATGFTRFPVVRADLDDVVGIVHVKDILVRDPDALAGLEVADVVRPVTAVAESRDLEGLLATMRAGRTHVVLVVDEFGGTAGIVTLEDVLEELVGEIEDEFDSGAAVRRRAGRDAWIVDGTLRRDELDRLTGLRLPEGETETVSGYLVERLGRLLERGDEVSEQGWRLRVLSLHGHRAGRIEVTRVGAEAEPDAEER